MKGFPLVSLLQDGMGPIHPSDLLGFAGMIAMEKFVEDTKADTQAAVTEWKAKRDRQKLEKRAERTRKYAEACIAVALCAAEEAEVAVLEAVAARRDADDM